MHRYLPFIDEKELASVIDEMDEMFVLLDAEDRIILTNKAWRELNKDISEFNQPGTPFIEHLRAGIKHGLAPEALGHEEEWLQERMERHLNPQGPFEVQRQDGRWILVHEQLLPNNHIVIIISDITEQKRIAEQLRQSEERFQAFIHNLPAKMHIKDAQGRYLLLNPVSEKLFNITNEEAFGKTALDIFPENIGEIFSAHDRAVLETGEPSTEEEEFPTDEGTRTFLTVKFPIRNAQGQVAAVGASGIDITERKQIEELLRQREQELSSVINNAPFNIVRYNKDARMIFINRMAEQSLGFNPADVMGKTPRERTGVKVVGIDNYQDKLEKVIRTGNSDRVEVSRVEPNGNQRIDSIYLVCERDSNGEIIGALAFGQEITEQRKAEQILKNAHKELEKAVAERTEQLRLEIEQRKQIARDLKFSEEKFRDIAQSSSDWFWEMGPDLRFTYIEETFLNLAGIEPKQIIGKTRCDLAAGGVDPEKLKQHLADMENHRPFRDFQYELKQPDGTPQHIRISGKPVFADNGDFLGYRGTGTNVTKQVESEHRAKTAQEEMRVAKEEAEMANRAKTDFLSSMSHELRTPMNAILGFAQLLELDDESSLNDTQREYVQHILVAGNHLLNLISDVLELNTIEEGRFLLDMKYISSRSLIEECLSQIQFKADENEIKLINHCQDTPDLILRSDPTRLKQVILNILTNAVKYNRRGGSIAVSCTEIPDDMIRITVSDTGSGIPESRQGSLLFAPFERLGREGGNIEGTGIGLAIAKRITELLGGNIDFESSEGEGSSFWVDIPQGVQHTDEEIIDSISESIDVSTEGGTITDGQHTILYIEDNPANLRLMEMIVGQFSELNMLTTHTAELGIDLALDNLPDLILMDINLPGMNGLQALKELRSMEQTAQIPVIAVSADAMPSEINAALDAGFDAYLTKPLDINNTLNSIKTFLPKQFSISNA